jgi:hypothetical protein
MSTCGRPERLRTVGAPAGWSSPDDGGPGSVPPQHRCGAPTDGPTPVREPPPRHPAPSRGVQRRARGPLRRSTEGRAAAHGDRPHEPVRLRPARHAPAQPVTAPPRRGAGHRRPHRITGLAVAGAHPGHGGRRRGRLPVDRGAELGRADRGRHRPRAGRQALRVRQRRTGRLRLLGVDPVRLPGGRHRAAALQPQPVGDGDTPVDRANLQPGDLVFFYQPVSHVGIYVGDGQMVDAGDESTGVVQRSVDMEGYDFARRIG